MKKTSIKHYVLFVMGGLVFILLTVSQILAQPSSCQIGDRATGLVSAKDTITKFGNTVNGQAVCIKETDQAAFVSYKLPTYDDLKSIYYDQANPSDPPLNKTALTCNPCTQSNIPMTGGLNRLYFIPNNLNIDANLSGTGESGVVFVKENLSINQNITYGGPNSGVVFVVGGDINISKDADRIDAVLISQGTICTAYEAGGCPAANINAPQLLINGSLISLDSTKPIKFRRQLTDNTQPAEKIHYEPKYLVILRNVFADALQKWSEIQ
ncbi:hypothetical protein HY386_02000 [Candidatus Daviesbacteria bacterium]|nr:hypothetical protein [Candidatus Daviesbacteria bacterium]